MKEKCHKCKKEAVIFRRYEGRYLCKRHFCESIERKAKLTIRNHRMVQKGDKIVVAISGDAGTISLLHIMDKTFGEVPGTEIIAVSVDEGIKGFSKDSLEQAKKWCKKWGVKNEVRSFKKELGKTMDEKAKKIEPKDYNTYLSVGRRYILNKTAKELRADKLCVGNTLDNEAQSVIMNYVRGDMPRASRMGYMTDYSLQEELGNLFVRRIKPLREVPREEIVLYARLKGFGGDKRHPYKKGIRTDIMEFLNILEEKYSGISFSILETSDKLLPIVREQLEKGKIKLKRCKKCGEPSAQEVCKTCELWRN